MYLTPQEENELLEHAVEITNGATPATENLRIVKTEDNPDVIIDLEDDTNSRIAGWEE